MYILMVILNCIAWIVMVTVNTLAITVPLDNMTMAQLSDLYPTLFTPANITFSIWSVIYVLLLLFSLYQIYSIIRKKDLNITIEPFKFWYITSCILNTAWVFLWSYKEVSLSLAAMVLLLICVIIIYKALHKKDMLFSKTQLFFIRLPFSIYLGWISVATIANVAALLVHINWQPWGWGDVYQSWTIFVIVIAMILAVLSILKHNDYGYAAVIVWAYIGIILKRQSADIVYTKIIVASWMCIGLISLVAILTAIKQIGAYRTKKIQSVSEGK